MKDGKDAAADAAGTEQPMEVDEKSKGEKSKEKEKEKEKEKSKDEVCLYA